MKIPAAAVEILRVAAPTLLDALRLTGPWGAMGAAAGSFALKRWLPPAPDAPDGAPRKATQAEVVAAVADNAGDPDLVYDLQKAEVDLRKFEEENDFRFAELAVEDKKRAGDFQRDAGIARPLFRAGMALILLSLAIMLLTIGGCLALLFGLARLPAGTSPDMAAAVFGLIGQTIGFINGMSGVVVAFYWGGSQGDHSSNTRIADTMQDLARASVEQAGRAPVPLPPPPAPEPEPEEAAPLVPPAPAPPGLLAEVLPELVRPHKHFPDGVAWALAAGGVSVEGAPPQGTPGEPVSVRNAWKRFGPLFAAAARQYQVPVELLPAVALTESRADPSARRAEPRINDASTGIMQTLLRTARHALGRRDLTDDDLLDPATSINAGAAYIAQTRAMHHFDPVKVAVVYNAGSIKRDGGAANRWKMLVYPTGTGRHADTFCAWFADCMRVSAEQGWGRQEGVPSYAACLPAAARAEAPAAT